MKKQKTYRRFLLLAATLSILFIVPASTRGEEKKSPVFTDFESLLDGLSSPDRRTRTKASSTIGKYRKAVVTGINDILRGDPEIALDDLVVEKEIAPNSTKHLALKLVGEVRMSHRESYGIVGYLFKYLETKLINQDESEGLLVLYPAAGSATAGTWDSRYSARNCLYRVFQFAGEIRRSISFEALIEIDGIRTMRFVLEEYIKTRSGDLNAAPYLQKALEAAKKYQEEHGPGKSPWE